MIEGERVDLRAVEPSDLPLLASWLNDPRVMRYWGRPGQTLSVAEVAAREAADAARGNSRKYIIQTKDGHPVGQIDYYDLDWQNRSASVSILLGDPEYWGGGYGTSAMRALLGYLFRELDLHRVALTVHESNVRARLSYEKNGFVVEGTLRDWAYFEGTFTNGLAMAVLQDDFRRLTDG